MDETRINLAVIGAGYWGKNLVRIFSKLGVLHTVCEQDLDKLKELKKSYDSLNFTNSYADVLGNDALNTVVISTPAETHHPLAKEALLAGKDIFVEKPLAITADKGAELIELARKKDRILMVGHLLEYHPAIVKLKQFIHRGHLGRIQYIYSNRLNLGKIRREENILWSFAPHDISVILLLLNEMPEAVSAFGGNYLHKDIADVTVSNLSFASGVKAHIFVSWLHPYKEQKLVVVGDKKMVVFDDVSKEDKLLLFSHKINWVDRIPVPKKEDAERIDFNMEEPLLLECRHFLESVKTRKAPKTDGESALRVLRVLEACQMSLEKNGSLITLKEGSGSESCQHGYYAHPTATIEQPCRIGNGTKIWHYSHIMKGARIGKNCNIGQNVFIGSNSEIGNNVKLQNNISVYDAVKLQDDVFCGPSVVFTNVVNPRSSVSRKSEYKETLVKKGATLGANSTIVCGNTIGEYAFVGAGAVVTKDVPAYSLVYGNPATLKGWMCRCGVKLTFKKDKAQCTNCNEGYINRNGSVEPIKQGEK